MYLVMAKDCGMNLPSTSSRGIWPKGVSELRQRSKKKIKDLPTFLEFGPFLEGNAYVLEFDAGKRERLTRQLNCLIERNHI